MRAQDEPCETIFVGRLSKFRKIDIPVFGKLQSPTTTSNRGNFQLKGGGKGETDAQTLHFDHEVW